MELSRKDLCALVAEICRQIKAESGNKAYHGGIYPENISCSPDGTIGIGPAKKSDWGEQELKYIAPEIYWNNKACPQSDVYSLGLLLYYGASEGKLPFEGESNNAQLMRMSGKTVYAPAAAGTHLGDIIEKALRFKENERYRTPEELAVMLDYCEDNRLLKEKSGAEAIFQKDEEQLSDLEQMMLQIIEGNEEPDLTGEEQDDRALDSIMESVRRDTAESEQTEDELFAEAGLTRPEKKKDSEEDKVSLADIFGLDEPDPRDPTELDEEEEIRVYEPKGKQGIPILTEEKEPELAPITVKKKKAGSSREKAEEGEQKRRPLLVVMMLLAVLVIAAVVANILINAFSDQNGGRIPSGVSVVTPSSEPTQDPTVSAILSEEQIRRQGGPGLPVEAAVAAGIAPGAGGGPGGGGAGPVAAAVVEAAGTGLPVPVPALGPGRRRRGLFDGQIDPARVVDPYDLDLDRLALDEKVPDVRDIGVGDLRDVA